MDEDPSKKSSSIQPPSRLSMSSASPVMLGSVPPPPEMAALPVGYTSTSMPSGGYYSYLNVINNNNDMPYADDQPAPGTPPAPGSPSYHFQPMNMPFTTADSHSHSFSPSPMPTSSLDAREMSRRSMESGGVAASPLVLQPNPTLGGLSTNSASKVNSNNGSHGSATLPTPEKLNQSPPSSPDEKRLQPPVVETTHVHDTPASGVTHDTPTSTSDRLYTSHTMRFTGGTPRGGPPSVSSHIQLGVPFPSTPPAHTNKGLLSPYDAEQAPPPNPSGVAALPVPAPPPKASRKLADALVSSTMPTSITASTIPSVVAPSQLPSAPTAPLPTSAKVAQCIPPPSPSFNLSNNSSPLAAAPPGIPLPPSSATTSNSLEGESSPSPLPIKPPQVAPLGLPPLPPNAALTSGPSSLKMSGSMPSQTLGMPTPSPPAPAAVPVPAPSLVAAPAAAAETIPVTTAAAAAPPIPAPATVLGGAYPAAALPPPPPPPPPVAVPTAPPPPPPPAEPEAHIHETPFDILMSSAPPPPEGPTPGKHETPFDILMASSSSSTVPEMEPPSVVEELVEAPPVVVVAPPPPPPPPAVVVPLVTVAAPAPSLPQSDTAAPELPPPPADTVEKDNGSGSGSSRKHRHRHPKKSASSSSSMRASLYREPDSARPPAPLVQEQPPEQKEEQVLAVVPRLGVYTPLILQHDYLKTDIKRIAASSTYSFEELENYTFLLQPFQGKSLDAFEPVAAVRERYRKWSEVRPLRIRHERSAKADRKRISVISKDSRAESSVGPMAGRAERDEEGDSDERTMRRVHEITVDDFSDSLVGYDNIMLALSFCLFGTVMYCNDLTAAAVANFQNVHESHVKRETQIREERKAAAKREKLKAKQERDPADILSLDTETESSARSSAQASGQSGTKQPLLRISAVSLFRWLNSIGIDVLITSTDRTAGTSFCAKRCDVPHNGLQSGNGAPPPPTVEYPPTGTPDETADPFASWSIEQQAATERESAKATAAPRPWPPPSTPQNENRLLVALEFDRKKLVWSPITIDLPIRETAVALHKLHRASRKRQKQKQARLATQQKEDEKRQKEKAAEYQKYQSWRAKCEQKNEEWLDVQDAFYTDRLQEVERAALAKSTVVSVAETSGGDDRGGNVLPFAGMHYPTIVQTDFGLGPVLAQGMNKHFLTRIKLFGIVGFSLLSLAFGLALVIFASATLTSCVANATQQQCLSEAQRTASACAMDMYNEPYASTIANRYLYGRPVAPGNAVIVAIALTFAQLVFGVLMIFFAVRFLAVGSKWPCFFYVLQVAHVLLAMGMAGFSAYAVYRFHRQRNTFSCSDFHPQDRQQCASLVGQCSGIVYQVQEQATSPHTSLALAVLFMVFNAFLLFVSFIPNLPNKKLRAKLTPAVADTNAFRKSDFAPDGLLATHRRQLDEHLNWQLHKEVRRAIKHKDRFITHSITVGEMMKANREQSIRRMELNKRKPKNRWKVHHRKRKAHIAPLSYMQVPGADESLSDIAPDKEREVPLAPDMLLKVDHVSSSVAARRRKQALSGESAVLPLVADSAASSRRSPSDAPFSPNVPKRATVESDSVADSLFPFRRRGERDSEGTAVTFTAGAIPPRQASADVTTTTTAALTRQSSYVGRSSPAVERVLDRESGPFRRRTNSFAGMPSFPSFPMAATPESTAAGGTAASRAASPKRLPSPSAEGPRLNPFVTTTTSDRIQRKNLIELEPQISKIVERLKGSNTPGSSTKV